ncbi:hypothetical protein TPHA_0O01000 [Tetrapisispora phaffii CBS 4417]|uniref:ABC transporter domain-containing protein n=1 Tax=Tetrapisispora phaffii (strain ATCC 24235 / CBS 4417 / NBRC 1672 / NRRL Y-8282 / UCD 70-5) TaxID=1071381 RepID=G8C1P1_TETPH|nr:hypothetical protein TPHA_0O01000 [Tetrapisispora phaffii CBS 4417]CCE66069.1 hypothetical protein TPHA_0O01000 [Tetrapisispora phaffii CBS 4417]
MVFLAKLYLIWILSFVLYWNKGHGKSTGIDSLKVISLNGISENSNNNNDNETCPPCFNCMLPMFECKQFSTCNEFNGQCDCIEGFGGADCSVPLCGSPSHDNKNRPLRNDTVSDACDCDEGWSGINCNLCEVDSVCNRFMPDNSIEGTCNKNGMIVNKINSNCNVVNSKILKILNGKIPQITFICDKNENKCNFQFWIDQVESFYCDLNTCQFDIDLQNNQTSYHCDDISCKCISDTMLCGQNGSIDISDFLTEEIKGPGKFQCAIDIENSQEHDCKFEEAKMNDLISTIFGDDYIQLSCNSTECLHYSQVPGYLPPDLKHGQRKLSWTFNLLLTLIILILGSSFYYITNNISKSPFFTNITTAIGQNQVELPNDQYDFLKNDIPATLTFENVSYSITESEGIRRDEGKSNVKILQNVSGVAKPGEIMAIMGGSGAGKTTLLDILAMKDKTDGDVSGAIKINGKQLEKSYFRKLIGFVDQYDYLFPTLSVYETVLNSALLRLPSSMSFAAKQLRVLQVLDELRILEIKDRLIGNDYQRGISGGEKRRVSIACELVTSPSILILDEPTSGLDSNNANNVINCLVRLAQNHNRTIIVSIHQPRSNIFYSFNKLILLSNSRLIYSGEASNVTKFLEANKLYCPPGYNVADYLIDITVTNERVDADSVNKNNERIEPMASVGNNSSKQELGQESDILSDSFMESSFHTNVASEIRESIEFNTTDNNELPTINTSATFSEQLMILCSRTFKNVYRNPKLLIENYLLSIFLAFFLGTLYYNLSLDISGFQNRMGLFFFILTYFGFVTFTGLSTFAQERMIFIKERANNYYTPLAYYISKIVSDILPLRVFPPLFISLIIYPLAGLNIIDGYNNFLKFIVILILFNLGISLEILTAGIVFKDLNNSIIISVLILLGSILFSGLFINTDEIPYAAFKYFKSLSIFYYAYEALLVNEVKTLVLKEKKFGLDIEVPGATILSTFGFKVRNLALDINGLIAFNIVFLIVGYIALKYIVVEKR